MGVVLGLQESPRGTEPLDDHGVGLEDVHSGEIAYLGSEPPPIVYGADHGDPDRFTSVLVILTEPGRHLDDPGALVHRDEVFAEHHEGAGRAGEVGEQRAETAPDEVRARHRAEDLGPAEGVLVGLKAPVTDDDAPVAPLQHRVAEVRSDSERQVRRQGPRSRRPREHPERSPQQIRPVVDRFQVEAHRDRRVGAVPIGVVLAGLEVRQRRLALPAVGKDAEALVGEALFVQSLEGPQHALHEGEVHRLVGVLEVHPACLAGHVPLPGVGGPLYQLAAVGVEVVDAEGDHRLAAGQLELLLGGHLGRETVAVPAEATLDAMAAHRLEAWYGILHEAGQEVAVVGQAVREGGPVVEDVLGLGSMQGNRGLKSAVLLPKGEDLLLEGGIARLRGDLRVRARARCLGHGHTVGGHGR